MAAVSFAIGLGGGAPPRPPLPRPPAGPAGVGGTAAGDAAGGASGADNADITMSRSPSEDHRNSSIVSAISEPNVASRLSIGSSASSASLATLHDRITDAASVRITRLLAVTVVGTLRPSQPLHQPYQLLVLDLRSTFPHAERHHAPSLG